MGALSVTAGFAVLGLIATLLLIRTRYSRSHVEVGRPAAAVEQPASSHA